MNANRQTFHGITDTVAQADKTGHLITSSRKLAPYELSVVAQANTANGDIVLTLPSPVEAALQFVCVHAKLANSKTVTVKTSAGDASPTVIADASVVVFFSTGLVWVQVTTAALPEV